MGEIKIKDPNKQLVYTLITNEEGDKVEKVIIEFIEPRFLSDFFNYSMAIVPPVRPRSPEPVPPPFEENPKPPIVNRSSGEKVERTCPICGFIMKSSKCCGGATRWKCPKCGFTSF